MNFFGLLACFASFLAGSYWGQFDHTFVGFLMIFVPIISWGVSEVMWLPFAMRAMRLAR